MIWAAAGGTVVLIVIIIFLVVSRSKLNQRLGVKEQECETLKQKIKTLRAGLAARVSADPSLADLLGMYDDPNTDHSS